MCFLNEDTIALFTCYCVANMLEMQNTYLSSFPKQQGMEILTSHICPLFPSSFSSNLAASRIRSTLQAWYSQASGSLKIIITTE